MVEKVKSISPRFQDGLKAFADSPIIGEVHLISKVLLDPTIHYYEATLTILCLRRSVELV